MLGWNGVRGAEGLHPDLDLVNSLQDILQLLATWGGIHFSLKNPKLWKHLLTDALLSFKFADPDSLQLLQLQGRIGPAGAAAQCCDNGLGSLLEVF